MRPPHADHAERVGLVAQLDRLVALGGVQAQPAEVGVDRRRSRDDAEALRIQARDSHVGHDPAALVEELRVDDAAGAAVDVRVAHALQQGGSPGPFDGDLAERRHVDQADALAQCFGLLGQDGRVRRLGPAEAALLLPRPPPRPPGLAVVGALPAVLGREHRARVLHALVQRAVRRDGRARRCRADSAAGSSSGRPRVRSRPRRRDRGGRRRSARGGSDCRSSSLSPAVTSSATALPMPPAPPKPLSESPAAT